MTDPQCDRCDHLHERVENLEQRVETLSSPVIHVDQVDGDVAGGAIAKVDDRWILWIAALVAVFAAVWLIKQILRQSG